MQNKSSFLVKNYFPFFQKKERKFIFKENKLVLKNSFIQNQNVTAGINVPVSELKKKRKKKKVEQKLNWNQDTKVFCLESSK